MHPSVLELLEGPPASEKKISQLLKGSQQSSAAMDKEAGVQCTLLDEW